MSRYIDIIGLRFGKWTVVERAGRSKDGHVTWLCRCDCGETRFICRNDLKRGNTRQCKKCSTTTHGFFRLDIGKRLVKARDHMIERCYSKKYKGYHNYGGRGILVCKEWLDSPQSFYEWAVANGYKDNLTLDRIDNDKGYSPDNCRWVTAKEQARNTSRNVIVEYEGRRMCLAELAEVTGIKYSRLQNNIKRGYSVEQIKNR